MDLRPTTRGWALALAGIVAAGGGIALGSVDLLRAGCVLVVLVVVAAVAASFEHRTAHRHLQVHRTIDPQPLSVGKSALVCVHIAPTAGRRTPLGGLQLRERAAVELSGGRALRASVARRPSELTLTYHVHGTRRGRWPLGPITATVGDPFGLFHWSQVLGGAADLAVWPLVIPLDVPHHGQTSDPETSSRGARTPSSDDASLRGYRPGDDLRRVHWPSSAKRGTLLVRTDERSGKRPVTVLLDLPCDSAGTEWTISLAASIALAMLRAGHPIRFLTGTTSELVNRSPAAQQHAHPPWSETAAATLLDATIDLTPASTPDQTESRLLVATQALAAHDPGETIIAIVGPLSDHAQMALASAVGPGHGWVVVRTDQDVAESARRTQTALAHAGWLTSSATPGDDLAATWNVLVGSRP